MRLQSAYDAVCFGNLTSKISSLFSAKQKIFMPFSPLQMSGPMFIRTFVLDNVIEGNRVNARLKPDLESPVVAQLNSGDRVEGIIHPANNKWMEIKLPPPPVFISQRNISQKQEMPAIKHVWKRSMMKPFQILERDAGGCQS